MIKFVHPRLLAGIFLLIALAFILIGLAGCFTPEQARKQTNRIARKYPAILGEVYDKMFPCIPLKPDSTGFLTSLHGLDSLLKESQKVIEDQKDQYSRRYQKIYDSLKTASGGDGAVPCDTQLKMMLDWATKVRVNNENLTAQHNRDVALNDQLRTAIQNIKPVIQPKEDSFHIYQAMEKQRIAEEKFARADAQLQPRLAKEKGTYPVYVPVWIPWLLLILVLLIGFTRIKTKGFNPLALLNKK